MKILKVLKSRSLVAYMVLILLSLFLIREVGATTYYVSPSGNDTNSGSTNAPFRTIQRAANIVNPDDTVIVRNGTYSDMNTDHYVVFITRDGSAGNMITFRAENKWGAVLDGQNTAQIGFLLYGASYIRVEDFEIKNMRYGGIANSGSSPNYATNNYIYRNKIHDNGRYYVDPCVDYADADNGRTGIGACPSCGPITIDSNIIYTIGRLPGGACAQYSWFDYNHDHGLYISSDNATIKNNIVYDCKSGWALHAYPPPISDFTVINNTFYGTNPERDGHILISGDQSNWIIQNNIFHSPKSWAIQGASSDDTNIVIQNNLVYGAVIASSGNCDGVKWKCTNNITGDPRFTNLSGYDFHLRSDSPAINKGLSFSGRTKDADGNSIVGAPDIGAYEYTISDTTPPASPAIMEVK